MITKLIYKIFTHEEWKNFQSKNFFFNSLDAKSGFVHLSTKKQVKGTIKKYFFDQSILVLVSFKLADLKKNLKWEISRDGNLFPHFYGTLDIKKVYNFKIIRQSL